MFAAAGTPSETSEAIKCAAIELSSPLLSQVVRHIHSTQQGKCLSQSLPLRRMRDDAAASNSRSPVATPTRANVLPPPQEKTVLDPMQIRTSILASFNETPVVFPGCTKLQCQTPQCLICRSAFQKLNLSKCAGHAPCHPTGW